MKLFGILFLAGAFIIILSLSLGMCNDTAKVIKQEFAPSALLEKYKYFKNLSAAIDTKRADIKVYEDELSGLTKETKQDKEYFYQKRSEMMGLIAMHNQLCSEYNSAMAQFQFRFTNAGDLPASNLEPLPREIRPYITNIKH